MDDKLPGLPCAAGEHGSEDRGIQSPLQRRECHVHVRCLWVRLWLLVRARLKPGSSSFSLFVSVGASELFGVHGDNGSQSTAEHPLPVFFFHHFAVVGTGYGFGGPFLLEEGPGIGGWGFGSGEVVEVVFVP